VRRVLLIGGAGYVGTELQSSLLSAGYQVRVFDTFWYKSGMLYKADGKFDSRIEYVKGDIRDLPLLKKAMAGIDSCIHLACVSNDPSYELDPNLSRDINFDSFVNFVPLLNSSSTKRFIFASSSSVYGIKSEPNVTEELDCEPISDYSKYKVKCEEFLISNIGRKITTTILRPSTVCGYSRRQRFDLVVNVLTLNALRNGLIRVDGGDQYRPNLHIKDMVSCYLHVLESDSAAINLQTFNVAGENLKVLDIANKVKQELGQVPNIEILPVIDARSYRVSGEKIAKTLGFVPRFSVDDAIRDLISAYRANLFPDLDKSEYYNIRRMQELISSGKL